MVRCRAKGENYSYDFAASLQNTNEQSNLISERDLTAWKGAAERMLTNEIVLKVFSDYLARDNDFEVVLTSKQLVRYRKKLPVQRKSAYLQR